MCLKRPAPMGSPRRLCANGWAASWLRARRAWPMRPRARRSRPERLRRPRRWPIVELRRKRLTQARIAQALGVSASTVSRVLARAGLSHLADLEPAEPVVRYEHQAPGDLLHIDIKKLGRIQRPGHRVTGNRRDTVEGAGWDFVFVAIDDHARVAFTDIHPDERFPSAVQFLKDAVAYYQRLGVTIQRLLTDNGSAFRSRAFAALCHELGIKHRFTRPYRPQTNAISSRRRKVNRACKGTLHPVGLA
ncbi:transposase, IS481 family [Bordetella pertussis STO1-CHOM-0012]|nr:transposase, IS481 family [Bordetella pertussis STO1-CHOM-0012]